MKRCEFIREDSPPAKRSKFVTSEKNIFRVPHTCITTIHVDRTKFFDEEIDNIKEERKLRIFSCNNQLVKRADWFIANLEALKIQYQSFKENVEKNKPILTFKDLPMDTILIILNFLELPLQRYYYKFTPESDKLNRRIIPPHLSHFLCRLYYGYFHDDPQRVAHLLFPNIQLRGNERCSLLTSKGTYENKDLIRIIELCIPTNIRSLSIKTLTLNLALGAPKMLSRFSSLTALSLRHVSYAKENLTAIIESLQNLSNLDLRDQMLEIRDYASVFATTERPLKRLFLGDRNPRLSDDSLKFFIQRYPGLVELSYGNSSPLQASFSNDLCLLTKLERLYLNNVHFQEKSIGTMPTLSTTLRQLSLGSLGIAGEHFMIELLTKYPRLHTLSLMCDIKGRDWIQYIGKCTSLVRFTTDKMDELKAAKFGTSSSIRYLNINHDDKIVFSLLNGTPLSKQLQSLTLLSGPYTAYTADATTKIIHTIASNCPQLHTFNFSYNRNITSELIELLCKHCTALTDLSLANCELKDDSCAQLFLNPNLMRLDLTRNQISESIVLMRLNWTITDLDISYNRISNVGLKALLAENDTLTRLKVEGNEINAKGLKHALKNKSLTELSIGSKYHKLEDIVGKLVEQCTNIQHLNYQQLQ